MSNTEKNRAVLLQFVLQHARKMFNAPSGVLKRPFLDPGAQYASNLWDWDSYWAAEALLGIAEQLPEAERQTFYPTALEHARGSLLTFFDYQYLDGSMPILLTAKNADAFDSRNSSNNIAKPVIAQFARLLERHGALTLEERPVIVRGLRRLAECRINRSKKFPSGLYVWNTDTAIGVDDDPSAWARPAGSSAHIYLNSLVFADLTAAAELAGQWGFAEEAGFFAQQAGELQTAIQTYCFDKRDGLYYSADVQCVAVHPKWQEVYLHHSLEPFWHVLPLKIGSWCSFMPLWCKVATPEQAQRMVREHLVKPERFWTPYGIRSLAADERMYSPEVSRGNPSNWLGPVWIITSFVVWRGLKNYGFDAEARQLADNTLTLLSDDCVNNGVLHEYYSPETGRGISGPGFLNWNLLAVLMS